MILPANAPIVAAISPFVPQEHPGDVLPDVSLLDQNGRRLSLRGGARPALVSFAYTRCPDPTMCSLVTAKFAAMQRLLRGTGIRLVEVTLDPAYDRPPVLYRYALAAGALPARWSFATGRPSDVIALAQRFGIVFDRSNGGAIRHTDLVAIVAPDGTMIDRIDGANWSPNDVAAQARADAGLASSPLQRIALRLFARASAACGGGAGGMTVLAAIALFIALAIAFAIASLRLCSPTHPGRSRS